MKAEHQHTVDKCDEELAKVIKEINAKFEPVKRQSTIKSKSTLRKSFII